MHTLGVVTLTIRGHPYLFHVVDDDVPIEDDYMIGRGFLRRESAVLSYYTDVVTIRYDFMNRIPFLTLEERFYHLANRTPSTITPHILEFSSVDARSTHVNPPTNREKNHGPCMPNSTSLPQIEYISQVSPSDGDNTGTLRICSWNINGIRANITQGGFQFLIAEQPDII